MTLLIVFVQTLYIITNHFTDLGSAIGRAYVCVCANNNF